MVLLVCGLIDGLVLKLFFCARKVLLRFGLFRIGDLLPIRFVIRLGDKRLGDKRLVDNLFGDKRLGDKRVGDKRLGDNLFGDKRLGDKRLGDKRLGE